MMPSSTGFLFYDDARYWHRLSFCIVCRLWLFQGLASPRLTWVKLAIHLGQQGVVATVHMGYEHVQERWLRGFRRGVGGALRGGKDRLKGM